ncbi:hypothetical protein ACFIQF_02520 [Comamonas sp. J-3]|uniref:hypothetical protein n=1 Tax=Comamonas trifloxystrobinivorans TaxID=3350256 RepID=UPI00372A21F0
MQLYDLMITALRDHWKAHDNVQPQHFQLTQMALDEFNATRKLVTDTMNFRLPAGWEAEFMGVRLLVGDNNALVAQDGTIVALG